MRKLTVLFIAILFLVSSVQAAPSGAEALTEASQAVAYVEQLLSGDAVALEEQYLHTEELLAALGQGGGFAGLQKQLKALGKLKETGNVLVQKAGIYTSFGVPCRFLLQKLNIVLNVDPEGRIAGIVTAAYEEGEDPAAEGSTEEQTEEAGSPYREIELPLPVEGLGELPGVLTIPDGSGPFPAVILVHGSGPQDMDETLGENRPFRDLAEGLADRGIAVYRYDKRSYVYGAKLAADPSLTLFDETIADAAAAAALVSTREEIDSDRIYILGHSLGGQALPAVAELLGDSAAGYIFLAAPARSLVTLMREQYDFLYELNPPKGEEEEAQKTAAYELFDLLENPESLPENELTGGAYPAYWQYLVEYDALSAAESIQAPCLVLQGEEDYQVSMEDFRLWQEAFGDNPSWQFRSYPGLTHLFMEGSMQDGPAAYLNAGKVDTRVIEDIAAFILEVPEKAEKQ